VDEVKSRRPIYEYAEEKETVLQGRLDHHRGRFNDPTGWLCVSYKPAFRRPRTTPQDPNRYGESHKASASARAQGKTSRARARGQEKSAQAGNYRYRDR